MLFHKKYLSILIQITRKFGRNGPVDKSALVQAMTWRRTGAKSLPEPMMTQLTDPYMRHRALLYCKSIPIVIYIVSRRLYITITYIICSQQAAAHFNDR